MPTVKVAQARWTADLVNVNGATLAPSVASNGIEIPNDERSEHCWIAVTKNIACNVATWGYNSTIGWIRTDVFSLNSAQEARRLTGQTIFARMASQLLNSEQPVNTYFGFSPSW